MQPIIPNHIRLIIVHPNYCEQHLVLHQFVSQPNTAYVRLDGNALNEAAAIAQIEANAGSIVEIVHLAYLVLDECDRLEATALDNLILTLLNNLHSTKICILSRYLPQIVYKPSVLPVTQVIPVEKAYGLYDYTTIAPTHHVEVHAFGQGRVFVNGREVTQWRGEMSRHLFFYMIDNEIIPRELICQTFWANSTPKKAINVFQVTKGYMYDSLGIEPFEQQNHFFRHRQDIIISYDVADFHDLRQDGEVLRDEAQMLKARQLYKHTFLQSSEMPWIHTRRAELELRYFDMLRVLADVQQDVGKYDESLGTNLQVLAKYPTDEKTGAAVLEQLVRRNQPCEAAKIYRTVTIALHRNGFSPTGDLKKWGDIAVLRCP